MTDKYSKQRDLVKAVSALAIGKTLNDASCLCEAAGLAYRCVIVDGEACMITADCRSDRIGFIVNDGVVIQTMNG